MIPTPNPRTPNTAPEDIGIAAHSPEPLRPPFSGSPVKARLRQFANRLKGNALWMKKFLHGDK